MAPAAGLRSSLPIDELILADHNKVRLLFTEYTKAADADTKQQIAYMIIREISMHACKEEEVMYPLIGQLFGPEAYQHCLDEHRSVKIKLEQLNNMTVAENEAACDQLVTAIQLEFEQHGQEEETVEIPRLLQANLVDPMELALQFKQAETRAKTRPHPEAPDMPPGNIEMAPELHKQDVEADKARFGNNIPVMDNVQQMLSV